MSKFNVSNLTSRTVDQYRRANTRLNEKIKGTFVEKIVNFIRNVYVDYKEVVVSVKKDIKEKPVKAAFYFTGAGFLTYSLANNPNKQSFQAKYIECANDVSLMSPNTVNPTAVEHLNYIQRCYNNDLIRHTSLGLFSVVWVDKYSDQCDVYETNCSYMQVPLSKFTTRVLDVGFWNIWWVISRRMLDYDINY